ncbi:MAG TPA: BREX-3 system P-loop-containing protein BrxF [Syntrophomonadaceae bacterium]|nr:BREX-3 system P-loop-containing protein BrxF [Syntrophomonadaceae bacterium]
MCLLTDDIQEAIMAAQSRYFKLILAIPGILSDLGEQIPTTLIRGEEQRNHANSRERLQRESNTPEAEGWNGLMTALGITPVNLGLLLSHSLLEVEPRFRTLEIQDLFAQIIRGAEGDLVAIDHAEIFFQRDLQLDPLRILLQHSRNKVLIVRWPGVFSRNKLVYGEPHHPEYRCYEKVDTVVCLINQGGERY